MIYLQLKIFLKLFKHFLRDGSSWRPLFNLVVYNLQIQECIYLYVLVSLIYLISLILLQLFLQFIFDNFSVILILLEIFLKKIFIPINRAVDYSKVKFAKVVIDGQTYIIDDAFLNYLYDIKVINGSLTFTLKKEFIHHSIEEDVIYRYTYRYTYVLHDDKNIKAVLIFCFFPSFNFIVRVTFKGCKTVGSFILFPYKMPGEGRPRR